MSLKMTEGSRDALVRFLPTCGGTMGTMWHLARMIRDAKSYDLEEVLGELLNHSDSSALLELRDNCSKEGIVDFEDVISHFASYEHLSKFDTVQTAVGAELAPELRQVAHTLLPLTLVDGQYLYDNGRANVVFKNLVQIGPTKGTPYCHLASLIWFEDGGLSATILDRQLHNGVAERAATIAEIDYDEAPILSRSTKEAKDALGL